MSKYDIFISYARADKDEVCKLVDRLLDEGFKIWIDRSGIESGDAFKQVIFDAIEQSDIFLFFSSQSANTSPWTAKEIGVAVSLHKTIIPVRLDNSTPAKEVFFDLVNLDYCDLTNPETKDQEFDDLVMALHHKRPFTKLSSQPKEKRRLWKLRKAIIITLCCVLLAICCFGGILALSGKKTLPLPAYRGKLVDEFGRTIAYSEINYDLYLDQSAIPQYERDDFYRNLAGVLSGALHDKSAYQYYSQLVDGQNDCISLIASAISDSLKTSIEKAVLNANSVLSDRLVFASSYVRRYPLNGAAQSYIGNIMSEHEAVGTLENYFDKPLSGKDGYVLKRRLFPRVVRPVDGLDVRTTLNVDFQRFGDDVLRASLEQDVDLSEAALVLMEVQTGAIKAIVNLTKETETECVVDKENYIFSKLFEPGAAFQTVTLLSVFNDGMFSSMLDSIPTHHGQIPGLPFDAHMLDYELSTGKEKISLQDGLNRSFNYVFAHLGLLYEDKPEVYFQNILDFGFSNSTLADIGVSAPRVPLPDSSAYSSIFLAREAIGYSLQVTPLHLLTFYNAIANRGVMVKPSLSYGVEKAGKKVSSNTPEVIGRLCSKELASVISDALYETSIEGTSRRLKECSVAGKTATTQIAFNNGPSPYVDDDGLRVSQGLYVGFFPANSPKYSILVYLCSRPTLRSFYGGTLPAMVTGEIIQAFYEWNPSLDPNARWEKKDNDSNAID